MAHILQDALIRVIGSPAKERVFSGKTMLAERSRIPSNGICETEALDGHLRKNL